MASIVNNNNIGNNERKPPKIIKVCTSGKMYRTAFDADERLSLEFLVRSFTPSFGSWIQLETENLQVDHYIFSVVDSITGDKIVLHNDNDLNKVANEAYSRGTILRLEITGKLTTTVLAEEFMKNSFNQKYEKFKNNVQNLVTQQSELLGGSYLEIKQELLGESNNNNNNNNEMPNLAANMKVSVPPASRSNVNNNNTEGEQQQLSKQLSVSSLISKANARNSQRSVRIQQWFENTGAHIVEGKYNALLGNGFSKDNDEQIMRDVSRTFPTTEMYKKKDGLGQQRLRRVLNAYSIHNPQVGYVQGMNFISGYMLMHACEEDVFWILDALMKKPKYNLADIFTNGMSRLHLALYQTDMALKKVAPKLHVHFEELEITPVLWLPSWILPLFASKMQEPALSYSFDRIIAGGWTELIRVALAVLVMNEDRLLACNFEQCLEQLTEVLWLQRNFNERLINNGLNAIGSHLTEYDLSTYEYDYCGFDEKATEAQSVLMPDNVSTEMLTGGLILLAAGAVGLGVMLKKMSGGRGRGFR